MPAQWVTIIRIGGVAARHVADRFGGWAAARTTDNPNEWDPDQWPARVHAEVDELVQELDKHATRPPVLFYCRYIDLWSCWAVFDDLYLPRPLKAYSPRYSVHCHPLHPEDASIRGALKKQLRRKHFAIEDRWFLQRMFEAVEAWDQLVPEGVILIVREVFGGAVEDREIETALQELPDWV